MKKILFIFISLTLFGCNASAPLSEDLGYKGQSLEGLGVRELLSQLKSNPEVKIRTERGWQIAEVKSERALYSFTPESHPAHPSYVKREVVEKDGAIYIETSASCGADRSMCDQLIRDFIELNNKVKESVGSE